MKRTKPKRATAKPLTDAELDRVLRAANVPARPRSYWKEFPKRVTAAVRKGTVTALAK